MTEIPELAGVEHEFVTARGARFHVALAGPEGGPVVVLLHGWPQHWWMWRHVLGPLAAAGARVVAPDHRGYGWSEATADGYSTAERAIDALAVLDALGVGTFRLAGHDWGGAAAVAIALGRPERVERLTVMSIPSPWVPRDARTVWASLKGFWYMPFLASPLGPKLVARPDFLKRTVAGEARGGWSARDTELYQQRLDPHATRRTYAAALSAGAGGRLHTPTLWLHGERDTAIRPDHLRGLREHADDITIEVLPGLGHFMAEQAPKLVTAKLIDQSIH